MKLMIVVTPTRPIVHGSACAMHLGDRRREERERQAEVTVEELAPVVEVLLPEALVLVEPEEDVERVRSRAVLIWPWNSAIERRAPGRPGSAAG